MRTAALLSLYAAALALGLSQTFGPTFRSGFARVQTETGDGMLNHYILEHSWQSVTNPDYRGSLFSPPCFYPEPHTLWYSEHLLGVAPVYWALRVALPYDLAYQWWQIVLAALNFVAFAAVVRWLRCPHALAILGGYLWGFALIHIDQIKHQQMIPRFMMPLAAYHAWMFVLAVGSEPANPLRHLNRMLAAVFVQGITCVNTTWFLVMGLATFIPLALALRPGGWRDAVRHLWAQRWRTLAIVGGWTAALSAAYAPYMVINRGHERTYEESLPLIPTGAAWLSGVPGTVWEWVVATYRNRTIDECWLFCGFAVYALMLVPAAYLLATISRTDAPRDFGPVLAGLLTAGLWAALTLQVGERDPVSAWEWVRQIPGATAIRCVSRVYVAVYLFGTLSAIVWLARVTEVLEPRNRLAVLTLIAAVCVVEQLGYDPPSFEKADFYPFVDRVAEELKKGDIGHVVPRFTDMKGELWKGPYGEVFAMWCGLRANVPVVNGYSGRVPDVLFDRVARAPDEWRENLLREWLQSRNVRGRVAVVDPDNLAATRVIVIE
jgi:hypothetical protein